MIRPTLTGDAGGTPILAPLVAQWTTSTDMLLERLTGLTDHEYRWHPLPQSADLVRHHDGTTRVPEDLPDRGARTIAWTLGHLADMCWVRADYADGTKSRPLVYQPFPATADAGVAEFAAAAERWRTTLVTATAAQALQVGYSSYPDGMDPELPFVDIAWWMNRELIAHGADAATARDLYAAS